MGLPWRFLFILGIPIRTIATTGMSTPYKLREEYKTKD
jgi:hypothetical protein